MLLKFYVELSFWNELDSKDAVTAHSSHSLHVVLRGDIIYEGGSKDVLNRFTDPLQMNS